MNAKKKQLLGKLLVFSLSGAMLVGQAVGVVKGPSVTASANEATEEILYYDSEIFQGQGTQTSSTYSITCDEMILVDYAAHTSAPALWKLNNSYMSNYCGALAGRNVIVFYDRWLTDLVPDHVPGVMASNGIYRYYPDLGTTACENVLVSLYDLMQIATVGGTTSNNFRSGISTYATSKGYTASYSSFYESATSVDLSLLTNAIEQNKVGVVMCSEYNFVYGISLNTSESRAQIARIDSTTAHMMMVYGYETHAFYNDGEYVCTKTFLLVSSGFGDGPQGYMELNDFSVINEAVIVGIS